MKMEIPSKDERRIPSVFGPSGHDFDQDTIPTNDVGRTNLVVSSLPAPLLLSGMIGDLVRLSIVYTSAPASEVLCMC